MCGCQQSNDYEYSWPITYGGTAGDYQIRAPWNGPAEMLIVSAFVQATGGAFISQAATQAGAVSSIVTTYTAGQQGTPGIYINAAPDGPVAFAPTWFPFNGQASLQVVGTALVTIAFRRKRPLNAAQQVEASVRPDDAPAPATNASASQNHTLRGGL